MKILKIAGVVIAGLVGVSLLKGGSKKSKKSFSELEAERIRREERRRRIIEERELEERRLKEARELEERRRATPCYFRGTITYSDFVSLVEEIAHHIKKLEVRVEGPIINGVVHSHSGGSRYKFQLDFNDFGHITGKYWVLLNEVPESSPKVKTFAEDIKEKIETILR